jgi:predicted RNA binding protein YcfA (HicA-like mRNA interferase family)
VTDRLPALGGRQVVRALQRAGFVVVRTRGSHSVLARPGEPGRAVIVPVHGNRDLKPGTIRSIIRQSGLSVSEFRDLL